MVLQIDLERLKKVRNLLVGIVGKPVKLEGSVELLFTLGDRHRKRT